MSCLQKKNAALLTVPQVDPVFGKVSSVGHYLEVLERQRMIWMSYLKTEGLNAAVRCIP